MPETWIALLRGINVGGSNKLPMTSLRATLVALGAVDVQPYIQSGNAVFRHAETNTATLGDGAGDGRVVEHRPRVTRCTRTGCTVRLNASPTRRPEDQSIAEPNR